MIKMKIVAQKWKKDRTEKKINETWIKKKIEERIKLYLLMRKYLISSCIYVSVDTVE